MRQMSDNRLSPARWLLMAVTGTVAFLIFALIQRSWQSFLVGLPIMAVLYILFFIRTGAAISEERQRRSHD